MRKDYNYRKANWVLGLVFVLFAATAGLKYFYPQSLGSRLLFAVFEAALVGGIADWFAVTALFRRPLGFRWHTAIIPANRAKLIDAVAAGVQNELLNKESIKRRLAEARLTEVLANWLEDPDNQAKVRGMAVKAAGKALQLITPDAIARFGQKLLKRYLREAAFTDKMIRLSGWLLANKKNDWLINYVLQKMLVVIEKDSTADYIWQQLDAYKKAAVKNWWQELALGIAELTDAVNTNDAAVALKRELEGFLRELCYVDHPVRKWLNESLAASADGVANDPQWRKAVMEWQHGLAKRLELENMLVAVVEAMAAGLSPGKVEAWACLQADRLIGIYKTDQALRAWLEIRLQAALGELIDSDSNLAATVVTEALQELSDQDLNRFVEDKAGEDLEWIRINGSLVGGVVGLGLFLFMTYVYEPYFEAWVSAFL